MSTIRRFARVLTLAAAMFLIACGAPAPGPTDIQSCPDGQHMEVKKVVTQGVTQEVGYHCVKDAAPTTPSTPDGGGQQPTPAQSCAQASPATPDACGMFCTNRQLDNSNCGSCGNRCDTNNGKTCQGGACVTITATTPTCHGLQVQLPSGHDARTCRGFDVYGQQVWSVDARGSVWFAGPTGVCAITCINSAGTATILPSQISGIWVPNGANDVARWYKAGCNRLRWHAPGDPYARGGAWDGFCEE